LGLGSGSTFGKHVGKGVIVFEVGDRQKKRKGTKSQDDTSGVEYGRRATQRESNEHTAAKEEVPSEQRKVTVAGGVGFGKRDLRSKQTWSEKEKPQK